MHADVRLFDRGVFSLATMMAGLFPPLWAELACPVLFYCLIIYHIIYHNGFTINKKAVRSGRSGRSPGSETDSLLISRVGVLIARPRAGVYRLTMTYPLFTLSSLSFFV